MSHDQNAEQNHKVTVVNKSFQNYAKVHIPYLQAKNQYMGNAYCQQSFVFMSAT
jgi:hypothetical protein